MRGSNNQIFWGAARFVLYSCVSSTSQCYICATYVFSHRFRSLNFLHPNKKAAKNNITRSPQYGCYPLRRAKQD